MNTIYPIGRANTNRSIFENCHSHGTFFYFGHHLYIDMSQNLYIGNDGAYNHVFDITNGNLPIDEIEVFSVVEK